MTSLAMPEPVAGVMRRRAEIAAALCAIVPGEGVVADPDGMICEFTVDHPTADKINAEKKLNAHSELKRWLAGDHTSNNMFRSESH